MCLAQGPQRSDAGEARTRAPSVHALIKVDRKVGHDSVDSCVVRYFHLSRDMRFPTMWYMRPAKARTSLRICAV